MTKWETYGVTSRWVIWPTNGDIWIKQVPFHYFSAKSILIE